MLGMIPLIWCPMPGSVFDKTLLKCPFLHNVRVVHFGSRPLAWSFYVVFIIVRSFNLITLTPCEFQVYDRS